MRLKILQILVNILCALVIGPSSFAQFQYISPVPGSKMHNPETNIILRNGDLINESSIHNASLFSVIGSTSGKHSVNSILSDDGKTILLQPEVPFLEGETVTVEITDGIKTTTGKIIKGTSFNFYTRSERTAELQKKLDDARRHVFEEEFGSSLSKKGSTTRDISEWEGGIPPFSIWANTNPAPGDVFFHNFTFALDPTAHYCIINNEGDSIYGKYDQVRGNNFYLNHNGYLSLYNETNFRFETLDSNYATLDKYYCGNGYLADIHEFQIFPDGHSYLISYDPQPFDMTVYNPNYNPNATVIGCIVQELDANKNVVFQWRSWDYFEVTDATHTLLTTDEIDYVHGNSIEVDNDGNILLSCRHMDEITKISHTTGDLIWRMGGIHNEFNFTNDPDKFSHQHDVRRISNGNITVMDNGSYHVPPRSYAKEYSVNEVTKQVTLVWSYSRPVGSGFLFGSAMGGVQRLPNGNTLICWGLIYDPAAPSLTEVTPAGEIVWEMRLDNEFNDGIYRAHRFVWTPCSRPTSSTLKSSNITQTSATLKWKPATNASAYVVQYKKVSETTWKNVSTNGTSLTLNTLTPGTQYTWKVRSKCQAPNPPKSVFTTAKKFTTLPLKLEADAVENAITIYPNPANDLFNIRIDLHEETIKVRALDVLAQEVYSTVLNGNGERTLSISTAQWPKGVYFIEVDGGAEKSVQKLTVQ